MKRLTTLFSLLVAFSAFAQTGYEIKVTFKPFKKQYIYLGHYFGKTYPIVDSALLNDKSEAVFKGTKTLQGGIYLVGYPNKAGFFEILVDKNQHFSVIADTAIISKGAKFINSTDNVLFVNYQQHMNAEGKKINTLQQKLKTATTKKDSAQMNDELAKIEKAVNIYREELTKKNPGSILTVLLKSMQEPVLTGVLKNPITKQDSLEAYNYYKAHYWDGVNFWDGRLAYTPFFENKIDKYFEQLILLHPDSVIKEIDWMLGYASANEEMNRFLLVKFINRYLNQKYMWEDAVFVHLFEKYFASKTYTWLNEKGRKTITDRAYSLMSNIMGTPASDIELPDTAGKQTSLYEMAANYVIVAFWDVNCGHCKEVLPKLDSFYTSKWKANGLKIYAVSKETEGNKTDWLNFIRDQKLNDWTHVYYSKADDKARIDASIPGYSQLFDVQTFPTLYLLDKDKRIIAKKLSYEQLDEILQLKLKGQ
ncbi:MAG: thioredoxin-like domain-containing protein [Chitinophagaceae bacterium]